MNLFRFRPIMVIFLIVALITACDVHQTIMPTMPTPLPTIAVHAGSPTPPSVQMIFTETPSPTVDLKESEQVDAVFKQFISRNSPGGAVIVIHEGRILYEAGYGLADLKNKIPITPQHIFHLASTGKHFTAVAVVMLAEQGKLNINDPIGKYIPELERFGEKVTILRLLQHTSGIPDYFDNNEELLKKLYERAERPTNDDVIAVLSEFGDLLFEPGEIRSYSNTGYEMLGSLIERVSGQSYTRFLEENIFASLGMVHTFSVPDPARMADPNITISYTRGEDGTIEAYEVDPLENLVGSGSVYSTVEDMYLYDQAMYTDKLVKQSDLAEVLKPPVLNNGQEASQGGAWRLGSSEFMGYSGHWLGFVSIYARDTNQQFSIMAFFNRDYGLPNLGNTMIRIANFFNYQ